MEEAYTHRDHVSKQKKTKLYNKSNHTNVLEKKYILKFTDDVIKFSFDLIS